MQAAEVSWRNLAARVWKDIQEDQILGFSAQIAFYTLLSLFPLLLLVADVFGLLAQGGNEVYDNLVSYAREFLPYDAFHLVFNTLKEVRADAGGFKLGFGILGTILAASSGTAAMMSGLNRAYELKETRPWWKSTLIAIGLTALLSIFAVAATALVLYGDVIGSWLTGYFGLETYFAIAWDIVHWPVALLLLLVDFVLLYRIGPDTKSKWHEVLPGALTGMVLWIIVSVLFRLYLRFFNTYSKTYGSLGAVIILLLWLYLSAAAILVGAEVNREIEKTQGRAAS